MEEKAKVMSQYEKKGIPQTQLLSVMDYGKGLFNMSILEAQNVVDYKVTQISLNLNQLDYRDMLNFHDQVIVILHRDVEKTHVSKTNLQHNLDKVEKQLKQERIVVKSKHNEVKEYEHKIIHLGR